MRVKWNRQLDGSLARRQAEEEAAAAAAQLNKDKPHPEVKHKSSPKIFRLFRRKKRNRRRDDEPDRSPETSFCTPSEADDEDCASISSVATVASQPITEVCHRDRTMSLFSSFRLNFPGGKKKSKRFTLPPAAPLFHEKEPENNRYSSPDLMREKLDAARSQTELSKSSPSVRNTKDPAASTPDDFQSLGELRTENSASFQQLKHASSKGAQGDAKLAKSVSFSDCQVSLSSKQVPCANARVFQTANGQTDLKTKPSRRKCLYRSTETEGTSCESKLTSNEADSLSVPTQASISNHSADSSKDRSEGVMSGIVSSNSRPIHTCEDVLRNRFAVADVRGQWMNDIHGTGRNGNICERQAEGSKNNNSSDKCAVMFNGKSTVTCNAPVSHNNLCPMKTSSKINTTRVTVQVPTVLLNAVDSKSRQSHPVQSAVDGTPRGNDVIYTDIVSCHPSNSRNSINYPVVNESHCNDDKSDIVPFRTPASSEQFSGIISSSFIDVSSDAVPFITETSSESLNITDSTYHDAPFTRAEDKLPSNSVRKVNELSTSETNGVKCDSFPTNRELLRQNLVQTKNDLHSSVPKDLHPNEFKVMKPVSSNVNLLPNFEKLHSHDFELSTSESDICNDSLNVCQLNEVCVHGSNQVVLTECDSASSNSCSSSELSSGDKESNSHHASEISLPHSPCDNIDNMSISLTGVELQPSLMTDSVVELDVLPGNIVSNDSAISSSASQFLTLLKSNCNNITSDSILQLNLLNWLRDDSESLYALCSSCSCYRKTSVLNVNSPNLHLDSLNNNALSDVASYLHKLTNTEDNLAFLLNNFSHSNRHGRSVSVWNASFVQDLISPHEIIRKEQQCLDSTEPRKFSDHVPVEDPTPYSTGRGKHGSEERCPDAFPSMNPSGSSSSNNVTLHESDLHRGGTDTPQFSAESGVDNKGGSEMLSEVGATVGFCGKSCDSSSVEVYLGRDQIRQSYPEIYDHPCYRDACDSGPISPEISVPTLNDSLLVEKYPESETMRFKKLCALESSPVSTYVPEVECENAAVKAAEKSLEREILLFDEFCTSEYSPKVLESTVLPELDTKSNMVNGYLVDHPPDLISPRSEVIQNVCSDTLHNSVISIPNGYHPENCVRDEIPIELDNVCLPTSESKCSVQSHNISEIRADIVQMSTFGDNVELNGVVFDGVRDKIKLFESGCPDIFLDGNANRNSSERRKSFDKSKISMIPSLKKCSSYSVNERQPRSSKPEGKQTKGRRRSSFDGSPERSKLETINGFHDSLSPKIPSSEKDLANQENLSPKSDYKLPSDSCAESEPVNVLDHFTTEVSSATSELAERCKSEELLTSHRRFATVPKPPEVQESHSKLPNRRHSSADAHFDETAHKSGKLCDAGPTAGLTSSVDLLIANESLDSSCIQVRSSNVTLDEVRGVQGQSECGLQSRCASLPLVIGQVRTTSPLNYARRNCPIRDGSRGKSRIPRKQSGVRSLHTKPVRPPMWLSKAELTQEIQRLGNLCELRTKELNRLKMETKHVSVGFDAFASLFKYMVDDLNALSVPRLSEDLKKTLKQLELAKQDLAYYEREVEEMKAHHCQELNDLSNKLFEVFHGEVTELSAKHQEEMTRLQSDHQKQIENLSTTFNATSEEALAKHEALVSRLQQELISQREELQLFHEREIMDLEEKHTQSTKTLQEHIEQLQKKCAELQHHSMGMEDAMRKDTDTKLQWVTSRKVDLEKEVESLKAVLEMKNKELHTIRVQNLEMEKQLEELPLAREKIKMLQARAEDLEALMIEKTKLERRLSTENQQIRDTYEKESKVNKRLSMENEELQWRIRQAEQSLLAGSFSDVLEYPEDVENGSISPAKSPAPQMMSRSVFFTFMDKEDPSSSPRSQYKKITPGFSASYKTSPGKSARSPPIPSPRRPKSQSEPPQPPVLSSSTPRKVPKQNSLKQKSAQKRQRSGSDCGKPMGEHAEIAFLSVAGSMTSSVSSESSVFGERLLEEHKEQILESLEILREQRSTEGDWCSEDGKTNEESPPNLEGDDMSRSSEFSDPKTYYHMTFPVMKEAGMPDCDMSTAAQAIHSTPDSSSPADSDDTKTLPLQEISAPGHQAVDSKPESNVKPAHSVDDVQECGKKSKEQDRWRTI